MINYSKALSDLQAEDHLFLLSERPHDLAWCQFTCFDKAHEGATRLQDILYWCKKKKKVGIFHANLNKSTSSLYFHQIKKVHDDSISPKKRKKRGR